MDRWTTLGFLDHFMHVHRMMPDRSFAFFLGAGASKSSGIPTGAELVREWLGDLQRQLDPAYGTRPIEEWATASSLGIPGFDARRPEQFYPQVFQRRFGRDVEQGYAALEHAMKDAEPGVGYSVLATILATERHCVVVTPNFDNLVEDALAIFAHTHPLIVGHESLAHFARPRMRRPLVAKVHRDLLLAPRNKPEELRELPPGWTTPLRSLLQHHTPIVIGYGGNDGGVMGLLDTIEPGGIPGGIIWCYREEDELPRQQIRNVVDRHQGSLVPILGFDEVMLLLNDRLKYPLLTHAIMAQAAKRQERYLSRVEAIRSRLNAAAHSPTATPAAIQVNRALEMAMERDLARAADAEGDADTREGLYRTGIGRFPDSTQLLVNGALFFTERGKHDEAERLYRSGIGRGVYRRNPKVAINFGVFLWRIRNNYDGAEEMFRLVLESAPDDARAAITYAAFLLERGKLADAAEQARRTLAACERFPSAYRPDFVTEALLYLAIIVRVGGEDDSEQLSRLKSELHTGFRRYARLGKPDLTDVLQRLPEKDRALYQDLAIAVFTVTDLHALDRHARWVSL